MLKCPLRGLGHGIVSSTPEWKEQKWCTWKDLNPQSFRVWTGTLSIELQAHSSTKFMNFLFFVVSKFLNRNRNISTSQLNALLRFHLKPINVIISHGSITIPNLEAGFPLRCFQGLSIPDIATEQCPWQDSSYTRGQFISVLSY